MTLLRSDDVLLFFRIFTGERNICYVCGRVGASTCHLVERSQGHRTPRAGLVIPVLPMRKFGFEETEQPKQDHTAFRDEESNQVCLTLRSRFVLFTLFVPFGRTVRTEQIPNFMFIYWFYRHQENSWCSMKLVNCQLITKTWRCLNKTNRTPGGA